MVCKWNTENHCDWQVVQWVIEPTKLHNTHANHSDSYFMQYYFATEKESLEESNYELELLSPTQEYLQLQAYVIDCSQRSTSRMCWSSHHNMSLLHHLKTFTHLTTTVKQLLMVVLLWAKPYQ